MQRAQLAAEKLLEVANDFKAMTRPFFSSGQLVLPAVILIVSGVKPS
jgi:hypothetical protein